MSSDGISVGGGQALAKLPVPELADSLDKFVRYVKVHVSDGEHRQLASLANELLHSELGKKLQSLLKQRAAESGTSWLLSWWTEQAYLAYPDSLAIWSNFYCQFTPTSPVPAACRPLYAACRERGVGPQALRTAIWTVELMQQRDDIMHDRLAASPLCQRLLNNAFGSCRVPAEPHDLIRRTAAVQRAADFIVVLRHDRLFLVRRLAEQRCFYRLARTYQAIIDAADAADAAAGHVPEPLPLGVLTAGDRHMWAAVYGLLRDSGEANARLLSAIEECAFVVCLDAVEPRDLHDADAALFHNRGRNRWFDKPIQLVSFPSGAGGANCEHAGWDGTAAVPIFERMLRNEAAHYTALPSLSPAADSGVPFEGPLRFQLDADTDAHATLRQRIAAGVQQTLPVFALESHATVLSHAYGKELVKAARLSPDALCQVAFQLAYYRCFARFAATYESASTRKFQWGRTETLRPVTDQSTAFVRAFAAPADVQPAPARLLELLHAASKEHSRRAAEASTDANAFDRHLFGLRQLLKTTGDPTPALFAHPAFARASHWQMSTSNISNDYFEVGWGAVVPDGFGVCYCIRDNMIAVKVSAQPHAGLPAHDFAAAISTALHDIGMLISKPAARL